MGDGSYQQYRLPLGMKLTGYYLFVAIVILVLGIPKAVYAYKGQPLISTTMDLVGGALFALLLFWLGVIEAKRPQLSPLFFQTDLAPPIWEFLSRDGVVFWCMSFAFVLLSTKQLYVVLYAMQDKENVYWTIANHLKDELILPISELIASMSTFFVLCVRVVWPRGFKEYHDIMSNIGSLMWYVHLIFIEITMMLMVFRDSPYLPSSFLAVVRNYPWMLLGSLYFLVGHKEHCEERAHSPPRDLMMAALVVSVEVLLVPLLGFPDFPECLYFMSFSCFVVVLFSHRSLATILKSGVSLIPCVWKAPTYGS